ncbi:unnamed protein product [Paramecium sonneborni]|uniref:FCP1 homology domain-containing protein n=1 Tax=Paramecium sonneborni TaxID=65129 RepID=A0A8S1QF65_9CILI|nr:unnamed protein product [Paramecium sonneborni]
MKIHEKDELLLCKFQTDTLQQEKLNQQIQQNYVFQTNSRIEKQTLIPSIQASKCGQNNKQCLQEQKSTPSENNRKFQEQSQLNQNDLSSKCHLLKNNTDSLKSTQMSINYQLIDDNLTCTSQTSSVKSIGKQKISIQTKKRIKKQKSSILGLTNQPVSRKKININRKISRKEEKSIPNILPFQNEKDQIVSVPIIETHIHQDVLLSEKTFSLQNQYYMHNLFGFIMGSLKNSFMAQMYISHFSQLYDNLQKSKLIECPLEYKLSNKIQPLKKPQKTLIIDLDETLVHCNEYSCLKSDFFIPMSFNEQIYQVGISIRPYAQQFLKSMAQEYEIMIFTASNPDYANKIIDYLDPQRNLVSYRLFRDDCIQISNNCHIKDLRILNRDMKDIVLIDNSAYSFAFQVENGIPIIPYLDDKNDKELLHLQHYLKHVLQFDDVRSQNNKIFNLKIVQNCVSITEAIKKLVASISK